MPRLSFSPLAFGSLYNTIHDMYNIRPSEHDYHVQKTFAGFIEPYKTYMEGKTADTLAKENMEVFNLGYKDIKYPWAASLSGGNVNQAVGHAMHQVSRNIMDLYSSVSQSTHDAKKRRWMEKQYRADFRR